MAVRGTINLKGLDDYLERIASAGRNVDQAAAKAVNAGADVVLNEIEGNAPEDTGNLKAHLMKTDVQQDGNFIYTEVGLPKTKAEIDADTARYGNAQEYGYVRNKKHYPGRFYIRDGFKSSRSAVLRAQKQALESEGVL